jgi:hypothetical protein
VRRNTMKSFPCGLLSGSVLVNQKPSQANFKALLKVFAASGKHSFPASYSQAQRQCKHP